MNLSILDSNRIMNITNSILTYHHITDGQIGIGTLPHELYSILKPMAAIYLSIVPDKSLTTYHSYFSELSGSLKLGFERIQNSEFFRRICMEKSCILKPLIEMNEIYYSNPKPDFLKQNLYGAAANLIPHRDCILYRFTGIDVYRVIIGLTNFNNDTITEFINFGIEQKINRGDYMIFDFDKTLHRVKKIGTSETQRILLKLHYIVCNNCIYSERYVEFIGWFYKIYYIVARYTEQLGTDPDTFMGFFFGLLWEYPFYPEFRTWISTLFFLNFGYYIFLNNISEKWKSLKTIGAYSLFYSLRNIFLLYLNIVAFYNIRWIVIGVR
jgi:hypothetical protein